MTKELILASGSPRRKDLLESEGVIFSVEPSGSEEDMKQEVAPEQLVQRLALSKAEDIAANHSDKDAVVLGADTVIAFEDEIIGKPQDPADAKKILQALSGNTHSVLTGVALIDTASDDKRTFYSETRITFHDLSEQQIDDYVATEEPLDKAGAYGIQAQGKALVAKVDGSFTNVVGLPVEETLKKLEEFGVKVAS